MTDAPDPRTSVTWVWSDFSTMAPGAGPLPQNTGEVNSAPRIAVAACLDRLLRPVECSESLLRRFDQPMDTAHRVLLVDPDLRSLRVLEVSLKKAGYLVVAAATAKEAEASAESNHPDAIVTELRLPDGGGVELVRRLQAGRDPAPCALYLAEAATAEEKLEALGSGTDDLLLKPALVRDIARRLRALLERRSQGGSAALRSGRLSQIALLDLLQLMEAGRRTGVLDLFTDAELSGGYEIGTVEGSLAFRDGQLVTGQVSAHDGAEALYRALFWEDGRFELRFEPVDVLDEVAHDLSSVILEGVRRLDRWWKLLERRAGGPGQRLDVDYSTLGLRFPRLPPEVHAVVRRFDGSRSLFQVVDEAEVGHDVAIDIVERLLDAGVLRGAEPMTDSGSLDDWLSGDLGLEGVPSALGAATIPSAHSPSELLAAEPIPSSSPRPRSASVVLSRRVVAANRAEAAPAELPPIVPEPRSGVPRISIHRVGSSVLPAASPRREDDAERTVESAVPPAVLARAWSSPEKPLDPWATDRWAHEVTAPPPRAAEPEPPGQERRAAAPALYIERAPAEEASFFQAPPEAEGGDIEWESMPTRPWPERLAPIAFVVFGVLLVAVVATVAIRGQQKAAPAGESGAATEIAAVSPPGGTPWASPIPDPASTETAEARTGDPQPVGEPLAQPDQPEPADRPEPAPPARAPEMALAGRPAEESAPAQTAPQRRETAPAVDPAQAARLEARIQAGESALSAGDYSAAEARFRDALAEDSRAPAALSGIAYAQLAQEQQAKARQAALKALRYDKANARANYVLGAIAQEQGDLRKACDRYRRYLRLGGGPEAAEVRAIIDGSECS